MPIKRRSRYRDPAGGGGSDSSGGGNSSGGGGGGGGAGRGTLGTSAAVDALVSRQPLLLCEDLEALLGELQRWGLALGLGFVLDLDFGVA